MNSMLIISDAVKWIYKEMQEMEIGFERAFKNYNSEWFNNTLTAEQMDKIKKRLEEK